MEVKEQECCSICKDKASFLQRMNVSQIVDLLKFIIAKMESKAYRNFFTCEVCQKSLIKFYEFTNLLSIYDQDHIDQVYKSDNGNVMENTEKMEDEYNSNVDETLTLESKEMSDISEAVKDEIEIEESFIKDEEVEFKIEKEETVEIERFEQQNKRKEKITSILLDRIPEVHMFGDDKNSDGVKVFQCHKCEFQTKFKCHLKRHMLVHSNYNEVEMFKCKHCQYEAKRKDHLKIHMLTHKNPDEIKMFKCNYCECETKRKSNLNLHMLKHQSSHEVKMFRCHNCEYKMDEENQINDKLKRKKELTNARVKKYRKKKRTESQQLNSSMQDDPSEEKQNKQVKENNAERKKAMAKERSRRYREKKRLNLLKSVHHVVHDSQIPGPSHGNPPLVLRNQRTTIHDSQIVGTSTNTSVPLVVRDDSESLNRIEENILSPLNKENQQVHVNGNLVLLEDQVCASPTLNVQINSYSTYARHSSAHVQFHKQFIQNKFGYACKICDRLWFIGDLKNLIDEDVEFVRTFLPNVDEHSMAVCSTCRTSIQKKSIPKMAVYNGFEYPTIPDNLRNCPLDIVSERLISPIIPFMQIRRLRHVHGQCGIYGQVINVPVEVNTMVNTLPRNINDDHCIYVHIKRKKIHKSSFLHGLINKQTIKKWLQYLVDTPLYKTYNITIDEQFFDNKHDEELPLDSSNENNEENNSNDLEDIPIEESLLAQQQTVMWNDDLYLRIAPGENNVPISLLFDKHAEELAFPSIYLGQFRQFRERFIGTPFMMATSELRRSDRRGVTPHHLLYVAMKIMRIRVRDSLSVAFEHIGKKCNITKEEIQSEDYIHNCIGSNLIFLRSIPNSTWYWSERKKDLFAMIRQLGKPTVFFTISANEIGWLDLLQLLYKLKTHVHITKEEISQLHYIVKSTLINEDAVTCAIYFNKLVNVVVNILQSKTCSPFRKYRIRHYFKRIEFQHQGSPHAHILAWLDNAPKDALNENYDDAIELIDMLISVSAAEASGNIKLQTHKHTFTCYKRITAKKAQKCRFEAPFMPCKKTMILTPMKKTEKGFITYQKQYAQIRVRLENEDFEDMDNFYNRNGINADEDYYNIIRAGITRPKVFVKREPSEKWHNPFNPFILNIVQSNTDFQFITEEYSCAAYVVEYVNKTNRGVSHLQRKIIETMNENPEFDIIDITKNISVNILNHTEITSQEAAWYLLREPMSKTSVIIIYIPTVWPIERQRIRKTMKELSELDDDCTDVWKENWFDKYEKRPEYLESITLAQFVSKYTQNREKEYTERHEPKIIRYRNYDMTIDFNEYKREMVTLHLPFRNEEEEILAEMKFVTIYDDNEDIILQRRKEFESDIDIDKTIQICRELCCEETPVEQLYNNPNSDINSDLQLATLNKLGAIVK